MKFRTSCKSSKRINDQLPTLLTFYKYPALIKEAIYTSNPIERMNKDFRKRLRPMNSLTNIEAAEKIIYLDALDYNDKWCNRAIRGFSDHQVKETLTLMFEERHLANAADLE